MRINRYIGGHNAVGNFCLSDSVGDVEKITIRGGAVKRLIYYFAIYHTLKLLS